MRAQNSRRLSHIENTLTSIRSSVSGIRGLTSKSEGVFSSTSITILSCSMALNAELKYQIQKILDRKIDPAINEQGMKWNTVGEGG